MNLSTKCNCCIKEDVCKIKEKYQEKENKIKEYTDIDIEVSVKCNKFSPKNNYRGE